MARRMLQDGSRQARSYHRLGTGQGQVYGFIPIGQRRLNLFALDLYDGTAPVSCSRGLPALGRLLSTKAGETPNVGLDSE